MTHSWRLTISAVGLAYAALWGLTAITGVPRIRTVGFAIVSDEALSRTLGLEQVPRRFPPCTVDRFAGLSPRNCVSAWTPGPFVLRMEYHRGIIEGSEWGEETDLWLFGLRICLSRRFRDVAEPCRVAA